MNTQQKLLNEINRSLGYTGEDLTFQSACNWLAENVHLVSGNTTKAPYVGDFMTIQTALNYIAENIGTGGGGGGAITADDIIRLIGTLGNVKATKSGNQVKLQCDDNPTGDGIYGKKKDGTWEVIPSGGGGGATVTDFRVDPNDPFGLEIHLSDGTVKKERLLDMHKEYLRGYTVSGTSILSRDYDVYFWKERLVLNKEFNIPLKVWDERKRKGNCSILTENGYDYVRYPEGDLQLTFKMDIDTRWRPFGEKNPNPITGDFQRVYRAYIRPIGGTTWTLAKEAVFDWTYANPYTEASFVFRTPTLIVVSPSTPFDVRFTWAFTKMGNDPTDLLNNDLRFGLDNMNGSPNEGGISITTKKLVVEQWYDY